MRPSRDVRPVPEPSGTSVPRVHVVDDSRETLVIVNELLETSGYEVVLHEDGLEFLEAFEPHHPQCLLLDIRLPHVSGLEVQRRLQQRDQVLPTVFMTGHGSTSVAVQAFRQGAEDFLEKPLEPEALLDSIARAIEKDRRHEKQLEGSRVSDEKLRALTAREREVFELVASGLSSKGAASRLNISKKTVDLHRANMMRKLEVSSVADLMRIALTRGGARELRL